MSKGELVRTLKRTWYALLRCVRLSQLQLFFERVHTYITHVRVSLSIADNKRDGRISRVDSRILRNSPVHIYK